MKVRGILFDKDGTLVDYALTWQPINRRAGALAARGDPALYQTLMTKMGADPATGRASLHSWLAHGTTAQIARAFIHHGADFRLFDLTRELDALFLEGGTGATPVTDLAALFSSLAARGLALGIASSDNEVGCRGLAKAHAFEDHLCFVAGYDSGLRAKPAPDAALAFCEAAKLAPAEIAVVGDNLVDLDMGRAAGAGLLVAVLTGTGTHESLAAAADLVLDSVASLEAALWPEF